MNRSLFLLLLLGASGLLAAPVPADAQQQMSQQVLARYFAAVNEQTPRTRGIGMDMNFSARLPKMKKEGVLIARRIVSSLGRISFMVKSFTGDNTVKNYVIVKYMTAEVETADKTAEKAVDAAITPKNYKFKYKRAEVFNGRQAHVFELNPRKKRVGMFKGELWIDEETALPVRETGRLVKSPSIFLKRVDFTRTYAMHNGAALPAHIASTVQTRIAGKAELDIRYTNYGAEQAPESGEAPTP